MAQQVFPTKGNLIATKKTLALSTMGYDLMDKKRNILIREMMSLWTRQSACGTRWTASMTRPMRRFGTPTSLWV